MRLGIVFLALLSAALAGCVTQPPVSRNLSAAQKSAQSQREVEVLVGQSEINVAVPPSQMAAAAGGGLLMALIDVGVNQYHADSAEKSVQPIRAQLVDFDFDRAAMKEVQDKLSALRWLNVKASSFSKAISDDATSRKLDTTSADQVVFCTFGYYFSADFSTLTVNLYTSIYDKKVAPDKAPNRRMMRTNALYYHNFAYESYPGSGSSDKSSNLQHWQEDNGAGVRKALQTGIETTTRELVVDLQQDNAGPPVASGS